MITLVIKTFVMILFVKAAFGQDESQNENKKIMSEDVIILEKHSNNFYLSIQENINRSDKLHDVIFDYNYKFMQANKPVKSSFDITSAFGSNIKFGGLWEQYAIINFTPQMFIQPLDFINVYANHNISCFIPLSEIKTHLKSLLVQSMAVLAVDNSFKYLFQNRHWVMDIASFAMKNLLINFLINSTIKNNDNNYPVLEDRNYYYSISIRF